MVTPDVPTRACARSLLRIPGCCLHMRIAAASDLERIFASQLSKFLQKIIYSTAIRTCNLMNHEVASLTAQLHISFLYSPLNKVHYIFLIYFPRYYRGFLECLYAFVTFLLHRDTLISQSFKKSVSRSPCTLLVSTGIASLTLVISVIIWTVVLEWLH